MVLIPQSYLFYDIHGHPVEGLMGAVLMVYLFNLRLLVADSTLYVKVVD